MARVERTPGKTQTKLETWMRLKDERNREKYSKPTPLNKFHASAAGSCMRKVWFEKLLGRREFDIETKKIMLAGEIYHNWFQENILKSGQNELYINFKWGDLVVSGYVDHADFDEVEELKTTAALSYVLARPSEGHLRQLTIYLKALNRTRGKITYIEKNGIDMVEHVVEYDEKVFTETMNWFNEIYVMVKDNRSPARQPEFPNYWQCHNKRKGTYCPFYEECKEIEPGQPANVPVEEKGSVPPVKNPTEKFPPEPLTVKSENQSGGITAGVIKGETPIPPDLKAVAGIPVDLSNCKHKTIVHLNTDTVEGGIDVCKDCEARRPAGTIVWVRKPE